MNIVYTAIMLKKITIKEIAIHIKEPVIVIKYSIILSP